MDSDQTLSELFQLLWQMYKTVQLSLQQVERCCPRGQFFMLERLGVTIDRHGRDGTIPVSTLAAQLRVLPAAVSRSLRPLEAARLAARVPAPAGHRRALVRLPPAGVGRALRDSQYGAASDAGYYDVCRQEDGSALLTFVDHATKQQVVLCSQPNCTHDSDACPAWYSCGNALRVYPIGGRLAVLQGGAAAGSDGLVPGLDVMNADGSGRQTAFTFPASCWVSTLPHYHMAREVENL